MVNTATLSGRQALGSINQTLLQLQQEIDASEQQLEQLSDELIEVGQQQSQQFKALAHLRLNQILAGDVQNELQAMDRQVQTILGQRREARATLNAQIEESRQLTVVLEQKREGLEDVLETAGEAVQKLEQQIDQQLADKADYQAQWQLCRQAERIATFAEEKWQEAQQNRVQKGQPYEQDLLFSYLWTRSYGTSDYRTGALTRYLDKWVAGLCDYQAARPNYAMLLEIPLRLEKHALGLRADATAQLSTLETMETKVEQQLGLPAALQKQDDLQQEIEQLDSEITQQEQQKNMLLRQLSEFVSGQDDYFIQAEARVSAVLKQENIEALYQRARATDGAEDDRIALNISDKEQQLTRIKQNIHELKKGYDLHLKRLTEMEQLRQKFKQAHFDEPRSGFANKSLLLMMLNEFLKGVTSSGDVWDTLRREQRRSKPRGSQSSRRGGPGWPGEIGRRSPWAGTVGDRGRGRRSNHQPRRGGGGGFSTGGGF